MILNSRRVKWALRAIACCSVVCIGTTRNARLASASIYSFIETGTDDEIPVFDLTSLPAIQANKATLMFTPEGFAVLGYGTFGKTMSSPFVIGKIIPDEHSVLLNYHDLRQATSPDRIRRGAVGGKPLVV